MNPPPIPRVPPAKYRGLGDMVAAVAVPVAKALDNLAGTHLRDCPGCAARRAFLNLTRLSLFDSKIDNF